MRKYDTRWHFASGLDAKQGERTMTTKTRTQALAFALRLSIAADTNERSQQALEIAKQLATGMTAKQVASAKKIAAIV